MSRELEENEGLQWGKPGPGGAYWRSSAITGQGFFDKMGWCGSADPRKRPVNTKHGEADQMRRDIDEIRERREAEHQDNNSSEGLELVPLMKNQITGRPAKDPATGYMMSHGLSSTDVTRMADKKGANQYASSRNDNKQRYVDTLSHQVSLHGIDDVCDDDDDDLVQVADKQDYNRHNREYDEEQQKQHFQSWETFWGRPGYGAPREVLFVRFFVHSNFS